MKRTPALPDSFVPPSPQDGEEYLRNGIFCFNITRIIEDIEAGHCAFELSRTDVAVWNKINPEDTLEDGYVESADLTRPVILAEISPDKLAYYPDLDPGDWKLRGYNLIDGHHRMEKAARYGVQALAAYILPMESHIRYMYSGFQQYAEYWKDKQAELIRDSRRRARV
jgi:hypothetical protein